MNIFNRTVKNILLKEAPLTMRSFDRETPSQSQNQNINFTPYKKSARKPNIGIGNEMRGTISGKSTETTPIKQPLDDRYGYPDYKDIRTAITIISIVDPTPVTSIPDIIEDGYKFYSNPNTETAVTFLITVLFALPYIGLVKKIKALGKTKEAEKLFISQILGNKQDIINKARTLNPKLGEMTEKSFNYI